MRILIAGTTGDSMPPPYGGVPKVSLRYAKKWRKMGHNVGLVFVYKPEKADDLGANSDYFFEYDRKPTKFLKIAKTFERFLRNPVLYCRLLWAYFKIYPHFSREAIIYSGYGVQIDKLIKSYKPDILLLEGALIKAYMAGKVAKWLGVSVAIDTYAEIRDPDMGVNKHLDEAGRRKYWTGYLTCCDFVITLTNCSDGALRYLPKDRVKIFYDTCDYNQFHFYDNESKLEIRRSLGLPSDKLLVGMVGAFEFRKGHDYLIKAITEAAKKGSGAMAVICGGSGSSAKWKELAKEEGVEDRVKFFNQISELDMVRLYKSLDVYCNLSNTKRMCGLDLSLLEAMSSGLPLIVYDNGQLSEAVSEGNGFVLPMNDIAKVAESILKYEKMMPEERKKMGEGSAKIAEKTDLTLTSAIKAKWFEEAIKNNNRQK